MSEAIKPLLACLRDGQRPSVAALQAIFADIFAGKITPAQTGALLMGLEQIGIDAEMICAGAEAMRAHMVCVSTSLPCVDVCGTGGDGSHTLNISTAVSFVLAGCGLHVAKHGNRAMSSSSGAADVLEVLGVNLAANPQIIGRAVDEVGVGFMFAQAHHPAMVHVAPVRRELGFRTIFNLLGPISNPASARKQLVGVYSADKIMPMAQALQLLGCTDAWVVHGDGGLDEVSLSGPTQIAALRDSKITTFSLSPEDAGLERTPLKALKGGDAAFNAAAMKRLFDGEIGPYRNSVALNAAAALVAFGDASDLREGVTMANHALDSGRARAALDGLVALSNEATL